MALKSIKLHYYNHCACSASYPKFFVLCIGLAILSGSDLVLKFVKYHKIGADWENFKGRIDVYFLNLLLQIQVFNPYYNKNIYFVNN